MNDCLVIELVEFKIRTCSLFKSTREKVIDNENIS